MAKSDWLWLMLFVASTFGAAALGSMFTASSVNTWYVHLRKPGFNPPNWIFRPVWSALYLLMAMAAWLVWRSTGWADGRVALTLFFVQLGLNILWSALFFGLRQPGLAMVEIVFFLTAIIATATAFLHFPRLAFGMMAPYVLWVSFASILNLRIWQLNR